MDLISFSTSTSEKYIQYLCGGAHSCPTMQAARDESMPKFVISHKQNSFFFKKKKYIYHQKERSKEVLELRIMYVPIVYGLYSFSCP